jgi:predicted PolB exonuclease-like 3'-5' exonuclease
MLDTLQPSDIIFIDIETVPAVASASLLDLKMLELWDKKSQHFRSENQTPADVYQRAGIYAEFGKIICISVGFVTEATHAGFRIKSFFGDDEKKILAEFSGILTKFTRNSNAILCAHNGKEFDYPYIARRMIINGLTIPEALDNAGKKPWEVKLLDTMELWKFGDYKSYTSLDLLTTVLGVPTPKDDIDGSMVASVYWNDHDLARIVYYCEKDVLATAQVMMRFMNRDKIDEGRVESVTLI